MATVGIDRVVACYHPIQAFQAADGGPVAFTENKHHSRTLQLPCGQCVGCRLERSRQWAVRCMHESKLHPVNSFVTLTYETSHVPPFGSLHYPHVQAFLKRLRYAHGDKGPIRYFVVGEYGGLNLRPHYHALLFGVGFPDQKQFSKRNGITLYSSQTLDRIWSHGFTTIGEVTFESAAYCARYCLKKVTGHNSAEHYRTVDSTTGEVGQRTPEFCHMSLKNGGIGFGFMQKFQRDIYPDGMVVQRGGRYGKTPRYYDKKFKDLEPDQAESLAMERELRAYERRMDNTEARLAVKETVAGARLKFKKREL